MSSLFLGSSQQYGDGCETAGASQWDKAVDPHNFLLGRERPLTEDKEDLLGRQPGDSEELFPRYTSASAAATGQVTVNGKSLNLWTYGQLETLSQPVLRQRASAIRTALGEARCPPIPSGHQEDLIRWILHMQTEIAQPNQQAGRGQQGTGLVMPRSFEKELQDRPISRNQAGPASKQQDQPTVPFGLRTSPDCDAKRDNFRDLFKQQVSEKENAAEAFGKGAGAGGRRPHKALESSMDCFGVSNRDEKTTEGRRYLSCEDNIMTQRREWEASQRADPAANGGQTRARPVDAPHISDSSLTQHGVVTERVQDDRIMGDRRRHVYVQDKMVSVGVANTGSEAGLPANRKHLDDFRGQAFSESQGTQEYQSRWRRDPVGLRGSSMLC